MNGQNECLMAPRLQVRGIAPIPEDKALAAEDHPSQFNRATSSNSSSPNHITTVLDTQHLDMPRLRYQVHGPHIHIH